jgi:hypothetical protein
MDSSGFYVSEEMKRVIARESNLEHKFSSKYMLRVLINSPTVCNLDLVDTPGLLGSSKNPQSKKIVEEIVRHQIDRSPHALFLCVVPGSQIISDSLAITIIQEKQLQSKTMAIVSRADRCKEDQNGRATNYRQLLPLLTQIESDHGFKYGGVLVANLDAPLLTTHYSRLHKLAEMENALFNSNEPVFNQLRASNQVSMSAVVSRISNMFNEYVRETWVPLTLMALDEEKQALDDEDEDLGMPRAHDRANITNGPLMALMDAAGDAIEGRLETGAKELGTFWMESLRQLHGDVQKAFADGLQPLSPGAELLEFRKRVNTVRAIVNGVVSTWVNRAPRDVSQNIRRWLDMDDSPFRLGRFVGLLEAVEKKAFQLLDDSKLAILDQLSKRVGLLLEDPMSPALTASFFASIGNKPVKVGIKGDVMADVIIRDIVMSAFGEFMEQQAS